MGMAFLNRRLQEDRLLTGLHMNFAQDVSGNENPVQKGNFMQGSPGIHIPIFREGTQDPAVQTEDAKKEETKERVRLEVMEHLRSAFVDNPRILEGEEALKDEITRVAMQSIQKQVPFIAKMEQNKIVEEIIDLFLGYGPITPFIGDPTISEIMVNGPNQVYVEKEGKIWMTDTKFRNHEQLMGVIQKIVTQIGRRVDESAPMVDARLPDGSRVNVIIPPLSLKGPILTIRKFSETPFTVEDLIGFGTLTPPIALFLKSCVEAKINICISGGTGSGKTTLLNVLSSFIPDNERILTIEDAAELKLWQDHVIPLETKTKNAEGFGEVSMRDLVKNALRMRPDRIVVGEVRGGEALDMLQAMNTGHDGSLTTGHANSPRDMLSRIETMVLMAGMELPVRAIRDQIASAIHLIVHQARLKDGTRRITHITEITGMESDIIVMQDLFRFKQEGLNEEGKIQGKFLATGITPQFYDRFKNMGIHLPQILFQEGRE
jgi:pilus assembly protein CpaF